jgi:hypothetical protein
MVWASRAARLSGECSATQAATANRLALRPDRSFLFINVEPRTVLSYFCGYRFYGFCRRRRTVDGGRRNVCDEQYTERASLPIPFFIK